MKIKSEKNLKIQDKLCSFHKCKTITNLDIKILVSQMIPSKNKIH